MSYDFRTLSDGFHSSWALAFCFAFTRPCPLSSTSHVVVVAFIVIIVVADLIFPLLITLCNFHLDIGIGAGFDVGVLCLIFFLLSSSSSPSPWAIFSPLGIYQSAIAFSLDVFLAIAVLNPHVHLLLQASSLSRPFQLL